MISRALITWSDICDKVLQTLPAHLPYGQWPDGPSSWRAVPSDSHMPLSLPSGTSSNVSIMGGGVFLDHPVENRVCAVQSTGKVGRFRGQAAVTGILALSLLQQVI